MDYDENLQLLKRSFIGGGEGAFYFRALSHLQTLAHINWLDIGIGRDGKALSPFVEHCRSRGQTMSIVGVDPDSEPIQTIGAEVSWTLVRSVFQKWTTTSTFDLVSADQSLYYLEDPPAEMRRIITLVKPGGLLIAICWSQRDTLYRIRKRLFPDAASDLVGEDLEKLFRAQPELDLIDRAEFETRIDLGALRVDESMSKAAIRVVARTATCDDMSTRLQALAEVLNDFPTLARRRNLAFCWRRRAP